MLGLPNWIVLLVVGGLAAAGATGATLKIKNGEIASIHLAHVTARAAQKDEANRMLLANKDKNAATVAALNILVQTLENTNAAQKSYIKGVQIANGRFIAATCGLFDKNGRRRPDGGQSSGDGVSGDAAAAVGAAEAPLACLLPAGILDAVGDILARADGSEADAVTGHTYAVGVHDVLNKHAAAVAAP